MEESTKEVRTSIDHPQEDERISAPAYTFRIKAPLNAERVEVSVDGSSWSLCRYTSGYWWHDWSGYGSGEHEIVARVRPFDSRGYILRARRFTVELPARPEEALAQSAATQYTVIAPQSPGGLAKVLEALALGGVSFSHLLSLNVGGSAAVQFLAREDAALIDKLSSGGLTVTKRHAFALELGRHSAELNRLTRTLAQQDINILSLYGTSDGRRIRIVLAVDRPAGAVDVVARLASKG
jgi:hypothetical protein